MRPPPDLPFSPHDDLLVKVLAALRMPGIDVHDVVQVHAHGRYLVELMEQWTSLTEDGAESDLSFAPAVDVELFRLDSVARWLDTADSCLTRPAFDRDRPAAFPMPKLWRKVGVK